MGRVEVPEEMARVLDEPRCPSCGRLDYDKMERGAFGVEITAHLCRAPENESRMDRFFHALLDGQGLDMPLGQQQKVLAEVILDLADFLLAKNRKYGGAVFTPSEGRVFSRHLTPGDQIAVRLDDKIGRIKAGAADDDEDPILDMAGYLILWLAGKRMEADAWNGS